MLAYVFFAAVTRALGAEAAAPVAVLWAWWSFAGAALTFPLQHWIARQARQSEQPELLSLDVIAERHYALNWLTGFHNPPGTDWDEIDTPS